MATNKKIIHKSKSKSRVTGILTKLIISTIIYIAILVFLRFDFSGEKLSAFLEKNLFDNTDIKSTISSVKEIYNEKITPVFNNLGGMYD